MKAVGPSDAKTFDLLLDKKFATFYIGLKAGKDHPAQTDGINTTYHFAFHQGLRDQPGITHAWDQVHG